MTSADPRLGGPGDDGEFGDRIEIRGLELLLHCGVLDEEQARRQPFRLDIDLYLDMTAAGTGDHLDDTVDYGTLINTLSQVMGDERYQLLERAATRVTEIVFESGGGPGVSAVTASIHKLRPPVPSHVTSTGVRVHRRRPTAG